jgi:CRP-like cAMP-binding protein/Pyruvate/2-oxoacid:ferredoxin oxidoreductase delta subunit
MDQGILTADLGGTPLTPAQLAAIPAFADIRPQIWEKFPGAVAKQNYRAGEFIFREGEHGTTAYYILSGEVSIYLTTPMASVQAKKRSRTGIFGGLTKISSHVKATPARTADDGPARTHIPVDGSVDLPRDNPIATLGPGELVGELTALAALKQDRGQRAKFYPRSATVQAKTDVEVLEILPHILNNVLYKSAAFKDKLGTNYRERAVDNHVRSVPIFRDVSQDFIEYLRSRVELVDFQPGEEICHQGDVADAFYLIRLGFVKVSQSFAGGEMVLTYLSRGGYFGEIGLLQSAFRIRARGQAPGQFSEAVFSLAPLQCGREPTAAAALAIAWDETVSREHFEIQIEGRQARVRQLPGGKNPITYRMRPCSSFLISPGEEFVVGKTTFEVVEDRAQTGYRTATCTAVDYVQLVRIKAQDFHQMLSQFPSVAEEIQEAARSRRQANAEMMNRVQMVSLDDFLTQELVQGQNLLLIDLEKCTRCDECVTACIATHEDGVTRLVREGLRFDKYLVPTSCRACMDPLCMTRCPVGSIRRKGSLDIVIEDWCIGCGNCAVDCPYGNINVVALSGLVQIGGQQSGSQKAEVRPKAITCDLCVEYDEPNCVRACPHDAALRVEPQTFFAHDLAGTRLAVVDQPASGAGKRPSSETVVVSGMADSSALLPKLRVSSGPLAGRLFQLSSPETTFGRGPENDYRFPDDELLSRNHCAIVCRDRRFIIRDNDATNGTFVNGNRVTGEHELLHGDLIRIGEMDLKVTADGVQ